MVVGGIVGQCNGQFVGGGGVDQWCVVYLYGVNGVCCFVQCGDVQLVQCVWQVSLVDDVDGVLFGMGVQGVGRDVVDVYGLEWSSVGVQLGGEFGFVDVVGGEGEYGVDIVVVISFQGKVVESEKQFVVDECGLFVVVDEGMVVYGVEVVSCGQCCYIGLFVVVGEVEWVGQC